MGFTDAVRRPVPDRDMRSAGRPAGQKARRIAVDAGRLGVDQPAAPPDAPPVVEVNGGRPLAHGDAAKHRHLAHQEAAAAGKLDVDPPHQPRAVEEDGFERQP